MKVIARDDGSGLDGDPDGVAHVSGVGDVADVGVPNVDRAGGKCKFRIGLLVLENLLDGELNGTDSVILSRTNNWSVLQNCQKRLSVVLCDFDVFFQNCQPCLHRLALAELGTEASRIARYFT